MENLRFLKSKEVKEILKLINEQWGCNIKLDYVFLMNKGGDVFLINKDVDRIEFENLRINNLGLYFAEYRNNELRLSIEGSHLVGPLAVKNILEISDEQLKEYMRGEDIEISDTDSGFLLVKNKEDFFGCSKVKNGKLLNFYPKSRRINYSL